MCVQGRNGHTTGDTCSHRTAACCLVPGRCTDGSRLRGVLSDHRVNIEMVGCMARYGAMHMAGRWLGQHHTAHGVWGFQPSLTFCHGLRGDVPVSPRQAVRVRLVFAAHNAICRIIAEEAAPIVEHVPGLVRDDDDVGLDRVRLDGGEHLRRAGALQEGTECK